MREKEEKKVDTVKECRSRELSGDLKGRVEGILQCIYYTKGDWLLHTWDSVDDFYHDKGETIM